MGSVKRDAVIGVAVLAVIVGLMALAVVAPMVQARETAPAGTVVEFNGQRMEVEGASTITVESSETVAVYESVTVTTKVVTVTVWNH